MARRATQVPVQGKRRPQGRVLRPGAMSERELSRNVVKMAELRGWRVFTISQTKAAGLRSHTGVGYPDLTMVRGSRLVVAELKSRRGRLRPGQLEWLTGIAAVPGCEGHLWRPRDWHDGVIEDILR